MALRSTENPDLNDEAPDAAPTIEVRTCGVREFRAAPSAMLAESEAIILTSGRTTRAIILPVKAAWYMDPAQKRAEVARLRKAFAAALQAYLARH